MVVAVVLAEQAAAMLELAQQEAQVAVEQAVLAAPAYQDRA